MKAVTRWPGLDFVPQYVKIKSKIIFEIKTEKFMGILIYYYHPHVRWLKYQRLSRFLFYTWGQQLHFIQTFRP